MDKNLLIANIERAAEAKGEKVTPACINAGVGSSFVTDIRRGRVPSIAKISQLAAYLGVTTSSLLGEPDIAYIAPPNYLLGKGVFHNWDEILRYKEDVFMELIKLIPAGMEMNSFSNKNLIAALDIAINFNFNEMKLVRWFNDCVENIDIYPNIEDPEDHAQVDIQFTQSFIELIRQYYFEHGEDNSYRITCFKQGLEEFLERHKNDFAQDTPKEPTTPQKPDILIKLNGLSPDAQNEVYAFIEFKRQQEGLD